MASLSQNTYISTLKQKRSKPIHTWKELACETLSYYPSKMRQQLNHGSKVSWQWRSYEHPYSKWNIIQRYSSQKMHVHINAWPTLTQLAATQHIWHQCMDMWMNGMTLKLRNKRINSNLNMLKTNKHVNKVNKSLRNIKHVKRNPK